jgi:hypothetical protein
MAFPPGNPTWLVEIFKSIIIAATGLFLLWRWQRAERHFYTDMPFLFGLGFLSIAAGTAVDGTFRSEIAPYTLFVFQIRTMLLGIGLILLLTSAVMVWFIERKTLSYVLVGVFTVLFLAVTWLGPIWLGGTEAAVRVSAMPFLLVVAIGVVSTFLIAWYMKRLPDVHGLVMAFGVGVTMIGQLLKNPLSAVQMMWASELIDLLGLVIVFIGFQIKPGYAKAASHPLRAE